MGDHCMNDIDTAAKTATYSVVPGDMYDWSDLAGTRPLPRGPVLTRFAVATASGASHLLVVGPHDLDLLDAAVDAAATTTVVVRTHADADLVSERYAARSVDVVCGDLRAWTPDRPVDAVLALDGLGRVATIDADPADWQAIAEHLAGIAPGGSRLALVVPNPGSPLAQLRTVTPEASDDNADWSFPVHDRGNPPSLADASARFAGRGYTLWPDVDSPTLAAAPEACSVALAVAHGRPADTPTLRELQPALGQTLDTLGAAAAAGGWLVARGLDPVPSVLGVDRTGDETSWTAADRSWLIEAMRDSARRDASGLRHRVRRLRDAVAGAPERWCGLQVDEIGLDADQVVPVHESTVKLGESADEILLGLLDELAAYLCVAGWRHPWPAGRGRDELAVLLAATVDLSVTPAEVRRVRQRRESSLSSNGMAPVVAGRQAPQDADPSELRKLMAENEALRGQVTWFKQQMRQRQTMTHEVRTAARRDVTALNSRIKELEDQLSARQATSMNRVARRATAVPGRARAGFGRVPGARRAARVLRRVRAALRRLARR
ncbi:LigA [Nocardioidaceae bacterium Broad-1]|nr:LigA [Nocardioidaceae bacterium Broad-1]